MAKAVDGWIRDRQVRVFHGHSRAGLLVALWLRRMGVRRVVVSVHCYGRQRWFYRWAARQFGDRLFWLSPEMKRYYGTPDAGSWSQCIPGGLDLANRHVGPAKKQGDGLRIGGAGMLVPWKRWDLVLDAFTKLRSDIRAKVRFTHIGAPVDEGKSQRYSTALKLRTSAAGLTDIVEWRGEAGSIEPLLEEIDCLLVASDAEPMSVAMLEALRAGVPVLAARSGGSSDVMVEPRNGWFFAPGDPDDLARTITHLVETDRRQLLDFRRDDLARFDVRTVAAQWGAVYDRLMAA